MFAQLRPAVVLTLLFTLLTGIVYPLLVTGLAQVVAPSAANGSLVASDGRIIGSRLIGQVFDEARYFHGRPSAAGEKGYDASASSGSNLGPLSRKLLDRIGAGVAEVRGESSEPVPGDAVTASGSGLDPDISPAYARLQAARIAAARGVAVERILAILSRETQTPYLGFIGELRVNVLALNLALDAGLAPGAG